jgi:hypothetical protein
MATLGNTTAIRDHNPPPMPDLTRDLIGLSALLTQAQITVRKLIVRADADEARKLLEVRS